MTSKSYPTRTTLWDDQAPADGSAPPVAAASTGRSAWRAPSAVLADRSPERSPDRGSDRSSRRAVSSIPSVSGVDDEDRAPIPRRSSFPTARAPWWRPRSAFGRILLGTACCAVLGGLVALAVVTRNFLVRDPHFRISGASSIDSSGLSEVNRADVLPVFGEDIGRNIFFVPLSERRKQLETIPWVQRATVMRFLPDRLSVSIVERTPVAFVRQGDQVELADADGVILSMPPSMMAQHHYSFPVVIGIDPRDSLPARRARMALYLRFVGELDRNNQHLTEQISEIDLSDPEDLRATMPEQGSDILAHFGEDQFLHRLEIYKAHIAEWRQRYPRLKGVDLRYNGEVPLEMDTAAPDRDPAPAANPAAAPAAAPPTAPKLKPAAKQTTAQTAAAKPAPARPAMQKPAKNSASAEASAKAARLKAATAAHAKAQKIKSAREKAALRKPHSPAHSATAALKQGQ